MLCFDFLYKFASNVPHSKSTEQDIIKNVNLNFPKCCVLILSTNLPQTSPILRALSKILLKMYIGIRVKNPSFLSNFNET